MIDSKNRKYWNIVKGLGILSIVIGHSCEALVPFVYLYHLAIFFFVSGYLYNEEKYGDEPYLHLSSKMKNNWKKYVGFSILFTLLHNVFLKFGIITNSNYYNFDTTITSILNTLLFFGTETMGGALWFVPVLILSSTLFGIMVFFSRKLSFSNKSDKDREKIKSTFVGIFTIISAIIGIYLNVKNINLMLHLQTIFLVIPFFSIGYFLKKDVRDLNSILKIYVFIPAVVFLYYVAYKSNIYINLASNVLGNFYFFYIISFVGIYFCLYLSKIILNVRFLKDYFGLLGKYSFEIMAMHFLIFKIIDCVYGNLLGFNESTYGAFPYAFKNLWFLYVILGVTVPVVLFLIIDRARKNRLIEKINITSKKILKVCKNYCKKHKKKIIMVLFIILIILFSIPIIKLGVIHNDELMSRYWSSQGFFTFYKHYFLEQLQKGRALSSVIIPFTMYLGFIGQSTYSFKIIQIISIIITGLMFGNLLKKIFNDKKILLLFLILFISFLPISFEPTVPNVFVTFYNVSICALIWSFSLFYDYLENGKFSKLVLSMLMFFIVELSYESFITYVPIYLLLVLYKKGYQLDDIKKNCKAIVSPILVGVFYLILYVISSKLFPSNYAGNQISRINIIVSLQIIFNLAKYTLPGSYLLSDKYQWLFNYYFSNFTKFDIIRVVAFLIVFVLLFCLLTKGKNEKKYSTSVLFKTIFIGICMVLLPILPISVATMYQNMDVGGVTLGLPVSFFGYFGTILVLTILIKYLTEKYNYVSYFIVISLCFLIFGVQMMNNVFSTEANNDFTRLQNIEKFISSNEIFKNLENVDVYAFDLFETKNALVIHDSYWNEFGKLHGVSTNFINKDTDNENNIVLKYLEEENVFMLQKNNYIYLMAMFKLNEKIGLDLNNSVDFEFFDNYKKIGDWYTYYYEINGDKVNICENDFKKLFKKCVIG